MSVERGWFADVDEEQHGTCKWQPCLNLNSGIIPSISAWFESREECERWMAENLVGVGWDEGEPKTPGLLIPGEER